MKKRSCAFLLALCLLLSACGCDSRAEADPSPSPSAAESAAPETQPSPEPSPELSQREQDWIEDIEFLRKEYKAQHMDPFYLRSEEESDWALDHLISQVGELSDEDITFEIIAFIAGMGDSHSSAYPATTLLLERRFPVLTQYFDGKLYLTACQEGFGQLEPYLLHEIVAVNGVDITYINKKVDSICNPFNSWLSREFAPGYYFAPAFFDWVGCDYTEGYTFQILNDNREVESVEIPVITNEEYAEGTWVVYSEDRKDQRVGNYAEYVDGENGGYVYMAADVLAPRAGYTFLRLAENIHEQLTAHPDCRKLVVDFRHNTGGDASMVEVLQENAQLLQAEQTYVLTDGMTASASLAYTSFFKNELGAVIVGEPTGQFTSFFHLSAHYEPLTLPHSQILVYLSDDWRDRDPIREEYYDENGRLYEWESTILPDVYVPQDIEDIRQGKDSVIEWVLAQ